jgi:hypothetical protein
MMGQGLFTALIALFWLAEFTFAGLVTYWFVTQGFADEDAATAGEVKPLESSTYTRNSLLLWAGFFAGIVLLIVVGA